MKTVVNTPLPRLDADDMTEFNAVVDGLGVHQRQAFYTALVARLNAEIARRGFVDLDTIMCAVVEAAAEAVTAARCH